jgi:hypothetical protein
MSSRPEIFRRQAEAQSAAASLYRFPSKPYPHSMMLVFKEFNYKEGFADGGYIDGLLNTGADSTGRRSSGVSLRSQRAIELPFPKQLQDSSNMMLNGFSRDPLVEKIVTGLEGILNGDGAQTLGGLPGAIQQAGANLAASLAQSQASGGGIGGAIQGFTSALRDTGVQDVASVTRYLMQKASPLLGDIGQSINLAAGQVLNPKETLAFEGVQLRSHQFSWDLFPSSAQDSDQINNIINLMKRSVLPRTQDFALGNVANFERAFLKYPHVCQIYLIGVDSGSWMKFKPAMVQNMTVDYAGGGTLGIMKGGKPAGVSISISLQELAIETANDYGEESLDPEVASYTAPPAAEASPSGATASGDQGDGLRG